MRLAVLCCFSLLLAACQRAEYTWGPAYQSDSRVINIKGAEIPFHEMNEAITAFNGKGTVYADITYRTPPQNRIPSSDLKVSLKRAKKISKIKDFLRDNGILDDHIHVASGTTDTVTIAVFALKKPICPGFDHRQGVQAPMGGESQFNCSIVSNEVAMIANPRAYALGRPLGNSDGVYHSRVVDQYRQGKVKELKIEKVNNSAAGG